jgi:hypothetical protein
LPLRSLFLRQQANPSPSPNRDATRPDAIPNRGRRPSNATTSPTGTTPSNATTSRCLRSSACNMALSRRARRGARRQSHLCAAPLPAKAQCRCVPLSGVVCCEATSQSFSASIALLKNSAAITRSSSAAALFEHCWDSLRQVAACRRRKPERSMSTTPRPLVRATEVTPERLTGS